MGFLRIHCDYCGGTWDVYNNNSARDKTARTCPHCQQKVNGFTWEKQILPAFTAMAACNKRLMLNHADQHTPLFTVDYVEDIVFPNARAKAAADVSNLQSSVDELKETIDVLLHSIVKVDFEQGKQPGKEQE
jgi:hypothetical protein